MFHRNVPEDLLQPQILFIPILLQLRKFNFKAHTKKRKIIKKKKWGNRSKNKKDGGEKKTTTKKKPKASRLFNKVKLVLSHLRPNMPCTMKAQELSVSHVTEQTI